MKKHFSILGLFFALSPLWSQTEGTLTVAVDTTTVKIGEQLNYILQIKADSTAQVLFPEQPLFAPFELLEESPVDTLRTQAHYLYTKKYALIQFDSGNYFIPQQQVLVNGFSKIADIIPIRVNTIVVDTTQQKLYDIKPLEEVAKNYDTLISQLLWGLLFAFVLGSVLYGYLFQKRRKELRDQERPPFDRALDELKALEKETPLVQEEYKIYYSRLTDVIRRYLEEEAKIDALESTSEELLVKLEMRKDAGTLDLELSTLKRLREVLQNADLVKFAKSTPEYGTALADRKTMENVVIETKEALPEPTEEELKAKAAYQEYLAKKRRKEQWIWGVSGLGIAAVLTLVVSMLIFGFYPVRDTLLRYPTKVMIGGEWVKSQYGTPPLLIETPEVLERVLETQAPLQEFRLGSFESPFFIDLQFDFPKPTSSTPEQGGTDPKQEDLEKGQELVNSILSKFEAQGAVNIFIKTEEMTLASGLPVAKIFGTLDYPKNGADNLVRCSFTALLLAFDQGTIIVTMMYEKEDRYAPQIEQRIVNSIELIKEL